MDSCKDNCEKSGKEHTKLLVAHIICNIVMLFGVVLLGSALMLVPMAVEIQYKYSLIAFIKIIICLTVGSILVISSANCMSKLNEKRKIWQSKNDEVSKNS